MAIYRKALVALNMPTARPFFYLSIFLIKYVFSNTISMLLMFQDSDLLLNLECMRERLPRRILIYTTITIIMTHTHTWFNDRWKSLNTCSIEMVYELLALKNNYYIVYNISMHFPSHFSFITMPIEYINLPPQSIVKLYHTHILCLKCVRQAKISVYLQKAYTDRHLVFLNQCFYHQRLRACGEGV